LKTLQQQISLREHENQQLERALHDNHDQITSLLKQLSETEQRHEAEKSRIAGQV